MPAKQNTEINYNNKAHIIQKTLDKEKIALNLK